jgi:hypothetical protein
VDLRHLNSKVPRTEPLAIDRSAAYVGYALLALAATAGRALFSPVRNPERCHRTDR